MNQNREQSSLKWVWVFCAITLLISSTALLLHFTNQNKTGIVYVDSFKLFSNYKGTLAVKGEYEKKLGVWKSNIDTLTTEFNNEVSNYEKSKSKMSSREKQLSEELLGTKRQQLENYRSVVAENASKEDKEVTTKITSEINEFLKRYGESHHLEYILGATNAGNVIYAKSGRDVTEDVLKELNNEYQTSTK